MPPPTSPIRRRLVVRGVVQGVFFRDTCRQVATAAGASGSVRNLDDGSVQIVLEGPADAVEQVVDWARVGPDAARVDQVEVYEEQARGAAGFSIAGEGSD
ncbi:MAG: acylphosphatase [Actinomycetota bacterium]|nr:acylphosphatase [Actinomycetota bacterium]